MADGTEEGIQRVRVISDWTNATLKEHVDAMLESIDKRITADVTHAKETAAQAQADALRANTKSEKASDDRFASHNEFNRRIDSILSQTVTLGVFNQFKDQYAADKLQLATDIGRFVTTTQWDDLAKRITLVSERLNAKDSESVGKKDVTDNSRSNIAIWISIATAIIILLPTVFNAVRPLAPAAVIQAPAPAPQVQYLPAPGPTGSTSTNSTTESTTRQR